MIYKGQLKSGQNSAALRGYNSGMNIIKEGHMFKCMGKNGRTYCVITHKTKNGAYIGCEIFPKVAVKVIWSKDDRLTIQVRALMSKRKTARKGSYSKGYKSNSYMKSYK